ncbi:MAG: hypothetical protein AAF550_12130 [Myxococcota bacterium]
MIRRPHLLILILGPTLIGTEALRARTAAHEEAAREYSSTYYLPSEEHLKILSFGYREMFADLIWSKGLIYFGEELTQRGKAEFVRSYAAAVVSLDPTLVDAYHWAGSAMLYHTGEVSTKDIEAAAEFLHQGLLKFPENGELHWDLGATLAYELAPRLADGSPRDAVLARATKHLVAASRLGSGPPWLVLASATQLRRLGRTEMAVRHLEEMYATSRDPQVRGQIATQIALMRDQAFADAMRASVAEFEEHWRSEYPYLEDTLYLLLGPRITTDTGELDLPSTREYAGENVHYPE